MKTYSVAEIAELLDTNQETVRRWIRNNKLKSVITSNKGGHVVSQKDLDAFLESAPKYVPKMAAGLAGKTSLIGVGIIGVSMMTVLLAKRVKQRQAENNWIQQEDLVEYLQTQIAEAENEISQKRQMIEKLQSELIDASVKLDKYKELLENKTLLSETLDAANRAVKG